MTENIFTVIDEVREVANQIANVMRQLLMKLDIQHDILAKTRRMYKGTPIEIMITVKPEIRLKRIHIKAGSCYVCAEWNKGDEIVDINLNCDEGDAQTLLDFLGASTGDSNGSHG